MCKETSSAIRSSVAAIGQHLAPTEQPQREHDDPPAPPAYLQDPTTLYNHVAKAEWNQVENYCRFLLKLQKSRNVSPETKRLGRAQLVLKDGNNDENTILHVACHLKPPTSVIQLLLKAYQRYEISDICKYQNKQGATPLYIACAHGVTEGTLSVLLDEDSSVVTMTTHQGQTVFDALFLRYFQWKHFASDKPKFRNVAQQALNEVISYSSTPIVQASPSLRSLMKCIVVLLRQGFGCRTNIGTVFCRASPYLPQELADLFLDAGIVKPAHPDHRTGMLPLHSIVSTDSTAIQSSPRLVQNQSYIVRRLVRAYPQSVRIRLPNGLTPFQQGLASGLEWQDNDNNNEPSLLEMLWTPDENESMAKNAMLHVDNVSASTLFSLLKLYPQAMHHLTIH